MQIIKQAILSLGVLCAFAVPALAFDLEVSTGFGGYSSSSSSFADARFYAPITKKTDLVFGFSSEIPGQKYVDGEGRQMSNSVLLGIRRPMVVLGDVDMYFIGVDPNGIRRVEGQDSDWQIQKFAVSKQWLYSLNDRINMGVRIVLGEVYLDGTKQINLISQVQPVIGVTIRL